MKTLAPLYPWKNLRNFTDARIALDRIGASVSTSELLQFRSAQAQARDAVHMQLDTDAIEHALSSQGFEFLRVRSKAVDRLQYLNRPDLGRILNRVSLEALQERAAASTKNRLTVIVADGLSAPATNKHAIPLFRMLQVHLKEWELDTVVIATQTRVALSDEIGKARKAKATVILLGERPGLNSPHSLSAYMTYEPKPGRTDAERNCISSIREGGLSYEEAAYRLHYLLNAARRTGVSGTSIKDSSDWMPYKGSIEN